MTDPHEPVAAHRQTGIDLPTEPVCASCAAALTEPYGYCSNCRAAFCVSCGRAHYCTAGCAAAGCIAGLCVRQVKDGALSSTWGLPGS
jgi:hypothetical protein